MLIMVVSGWSAPICAADSPLEANLLVDPGNGFGELRPIEKRIQGLLKRNKELETEYMALQKEFSGLRQKVGQSRKKIVALGKELVEAKQKREIASREMRSQSARAGTLTLKQLQLYDWQYQKRELELQIQLQEIVDQKKQEEYDEQINSLQKELEQNKERRGQLSVQIDELRKQGVNASDDIRLLKERNALLEAQIKALTDKAVSVENDEGLLASNIQAKEAELAELRYQVQALQMQQGLVDGAGGIPSKERLLEEIHRLDQGNQQLRNKIFMLRQEMSAR